MAEFAYKARNPKGKVITSVIEAETKDDAARRIKERGLYLLSIQEKEDVKKPNKRRVKGVHLAVFAKQMSAMVGVGIRQDEAIRICAEQAADKRFAQILREVRTDVANGMSLSEALRRRVSVFDEVFINLVRSGEASGDMSAALDTLADFINKQNYIRSKIVSAFIYPAIILGFAVIASIVLLIFVFPQIENLYVSLGGELPAITVLFLKLSDFLRAFWFVWMPTIAGFVYGVYHWIKTPSGRRFKDRFTSKIPFVGSFLQKMSLVKFSKTLSSLVSSGTNTADALSIAGSSSGNTLIEDAIEEVINGLREGERISSRMKSKEQVFSPMLINLVSVGEETGTLSEMLTQASTYYENDVDESTTRLGAVLDPILMVLVLGVVGVILAALYLPLFNMGSVIHGGI